MQRAFLAAAALVPLSGVAAPAAAQDLVAIKAGKVVTVTEGTLEDVVILIENGVIREIGADIEPSWNAKVIDASDKVVMPTWVLAHTSGGMSGSNERMANVPYLTVEDAIDPSSRFFEEARRNGVGTLHVVPGNSTLLGGRGMVVRPYGRTVEDMTVRTAGGMKMSLQPADGGRAAQIQKLRRAITDVQDYLRDFERRKEEWEKAKEAGAVDEEEFLEEVDPEKKPVVDLLAGKIPAFLYVPSAAEVSEAIRIVNQYSFPVTLVLGPQTWKAARRLQQIGRPVVVDDDLEVWEKDPETEDETLVCPPAELAKLEIPFALSLSESTSDRGRYPWWQMATLVRHGVDRQTAIESLTIVPARVLGLEKDVGSVEEGKLANLQILTGDPLQATTWVDTVLLDGEVVYERSEDPRLQHLFGDEDDRPTR